MELLRDYNSKINLNLMISEFTETYIERFKVDSAIYFPGPQMDSSSAEVLNWEDIEDLRQIDEMSMPSPVPIFTLAETDHGIELQRALDNLADASSAEVLNWEDIEELWQIDEISVPSPVPIFTSAATAHEMETQQMLDYLSVTSPVAMATEHAVEPQWILDNLSVSSPVTFITPSADHRDLELEFNWDSSLEPSPEPIYTSAEMETQQILDYLSVTSPVAMETEHEVEPQRILDNFPVSTPLTVIQSSADHQDLEPKCNCDSSSAFSSAVSQEEQGQDPQWNETHYSVFSPDAVQSPECKTFWDFNQNSIVSLPAVDNEMQIENDWVKQWMSVSDSQKFMTTI